ncbi:MAG: recombination protein RecR [Patescibacteria group bacterium]|nr:recombination protein RecR [Patescibacteria group bacterium]
MDNTQKLIELFKEFPGIGPRQAKRFVYFLLTRKNGYANELAKLIASIRSEVYSCESCYRFFQKDNTENTHCPICRNEHRDKETLMLVSHDVDFENIEKTKLYNGYYFILGGTIPILEKNPEYKIRQKELIAVLQTKIQSGLKEIIIALNYNPEGENTLSYLQHILEPITAPAKIKLSTLGRGLSTGTELEYSDTDTIKNALKNRQ